MKKHTMSENLARMTGLMNEFYERNIKARHVEMFFKDLEVTKRIMKKPFTNPTPIRKMKKNLTQKERKEFIDKYLGPIEPEKKKIAKISLGDFKNWIHSGNAILDPIRTPYEIYVSDKINKIISRLNTHYSKDVRGGKFGGKII